MGSPVSSQKPYSPVSRRFSAWLIFFSSLRSRSRVRSSSACSSSMVARSAGSGTMVVSSRRCSVVSPALDSRSSFCACRRTRKKSICCSFMYSASGMARSSASVRSRPGLVFHALASLGSALTAGFTMFMGSGSVRAAARAGPNRSAKVWVGGATGATTGCGEVFLLPPLEAEEGGGEAALESCGAGAPLLAAADLAAGAGMGAGAGAALAGPAFAAPPTALAAVLGAAGLVVLAGVLLTGLS